MLSRNRPLLGLLLCLAGLPAPALRAHPLPQKVYDRTITVRLTGDAVVVDYHLEVDALTAYTDLPDLVSRDELGGITSREAVFKAFLDGQAPLIANNLYATLDKKVLEFTCKERRCFLTEHLRCEYRLKAPWHPSPDAEHSFKFHEANFDQEKGAVRLSLTASPALTLLSVTQPDEALLARASIDLREGDEDRLRTARATFAVARETPEPEPPRDLRDLLLLVGLALGFLLGLAAVVKWSLKRMTR
ncbi:MAG: hypothetical protein HYS12_19650 [Planctomycetes bacterium]|nr:hypothetical protein [Planctomycetota bacterium]